MVHPQLKFSCVLPLKFMCTYAVHILICSTLITSGEIETEHHIFSCEQYFNERETVRANIFNKSGTSDLNCDLLLGCSKNEFRDTYGIAILYALSDFLTQTSWL